MVAREQLEKGRMSPESKDMFPRLYFSESDLIISLLSCESPTHELVGPRAS